MVGAPRFELGTYSTQNCRATWLRYAPKHATGRAAFVDAMEPRPGSRTTPFGEACNERCKDLPGP
jgi:hypothetical protein